VDRGDDVVRTVRFQLVVVNIMAGHPSIGKDNGAHALRVAWRVADDEAPCCTHLLTVDERATVL
jgi:hypothetical protein